MTDLNMALRRQGITGSEIAKVAGVSRYGGPLEVYARKLGLIPEIEDNPDMVRGRRLEPVLCDWAAEEVGLEPAICGTLQSSRNQIIIASPDRLLYRDSTQSELVAVEEVKAPGRTMRYWANPADDPTGIDPEYLPQVAWEMGAAGLDRAVVAALIYGELWVYQLQLDPELLGLLENVAEKFFRDHILRRHPPAVNSGRDLEVVKRMYPSDSTPALVMRADLDDLMISWRAADERAKQLQGTADMLKAQVLQEIGDRAGIEHPGQWRVTWKRNRPSMVTDWEQVAKDAEVDQVDIDLHTSEKPGNRVPRFFDLKE